MKYEFQVTYFFWTSRPNKSGQAPVLIRSKQNSDKQISFDTGLRLHPLQWDKKRNQPKNKPAILLELERKLKETYQDLVTQGYKPTLRDLIQHRNDVRKPADKGVIAWCDDYLRSAYSDGQKKAVKTLKTNVTNFNKNLTFDQLTKPTLRSFFEHLTERGVANNSQYKRYRSLVNVANHANLDVPDLRSYEFTYSTTNALRARLNWQEVQAIMKTEAMTLRERVAKDAFLLACFAGLRISDILTLNRGELHEYYYDRIQTKTKKPVLVTVHKYNEELFQKYINTGIPHPRQKLSKSLKGLLERSGLTKEITRYKQIGNKFHEIVSPKYKEISFHSGRRFYSRLLNDLGLGGEIARDELGHSFKNVTELYAGSQEHVFRVARVRKAMESLEETLEQLSLMKVA